MKPLSSSTQSAIVRQCQDGNLAAALAILCRRIGFKAGTSVLRGVFTSSALYDGPLDGDWMSVGRVAKEALRRAGTGLTPATRKAIVAAVHVRGDDGGKIVEGYDGDYRWSARFDKDLAQTLAAFDAL